MALIEPSQSVRSCSSIKQELSRRFSVAAKQYDELAVVQNTIAQVAMSRLAPTGVSAALDIGCATGIHTAQLGEHCGQVTGVDIADGMLIKARASFPQIQWVNGDAEALPLADNTFELVFSSMALQWCSSPDVAMAEIARVMANGAQAELAIMVSGSLYQLQKVSALCGFDPMVNSLEAEDNWQHAAVRAGLVINDATAREYEDYHADIVSLLRSVKGVGAGTRTQQQKTTSLLRRDLQRLESCYRDHYVQNNRLAVSYRVCHLTLSKES